MTVSFFVIPSFQLPPYFLRLSFQHFHLPGVRCAVDSSTFFSPVLSVVCVLVALLCCGTEKLSFFQSAALWKPCAKVRSVWLTIDMSCKWCLSRTMRYCVGIDVCVHTQVTAFVFTKVMFLCFYSLLVLLWLRGQGCFKRWNTLNKTN